AGHPGAEGRTPRAAGAAPGGCTLAVGRGVGPDGGPRPAGPAAAGAAPAGAPALLRPLPRALAPRRGRRLGHRRGLQRGPRVGGAPRLGRAGPATLDAGAPAADGRAREGPPRAPGPRYRAGAAPPTTGWRRREIGGPVRSTANER